MSLSQGCSNVVLTFLHNPNVSFILISSSPDFDVLNQQRVEVMIHSHVVGTRDRERVQVRCSDLVGSDLPHPLIDLRQNCCICQSPKARR